MKNIRFNISILFLLSVSIGTVTLASPNPIPGATLRIYPAGKQEGLIGITQESPVDNPADNIFHVNINDRLCGNEKVWLTFELEGVEDHSSVSRSINDQVAVGGYLVKRRRGWAVQREQINPAWLKEGDNIIRFTMPENARHNYRIRNLKVEVESPFENEEQETHIIFNQPSTHYYFDKAYIKGFIKGLKDVLKIKVHGKEARVFNGEFESIIDFESADNSCEVEVEATYFDGSTSCHSISFSEPQTLDYSYSLENFTYRAEKYFSLNKAETIALNGAALHAAADALKASATLSITSLREVDIPALDGGMVNVTRYHSGFRLLPHGTIFNKEVDVRLPYDTEKIPDGYTEQDIRTYYFDEQSHHWVPLSLDTVLSESGEVVSKTIHFTDMINGIIKVPESPEVEAYNSTSMKGIKAANPTAAVNLINPPQANNTGSASLGYPINIPAGRGGMQPQLSISYNSGGGNGWMGLGWNLSLPMITIDTRWGVPRFDLAKETETYSMNGEQLTPLGHRGPLQNRYASGKEFFPRVEGAFNRIKRFGDTPADYFWEVTDKSGTKYFYGATKNGGFDKTAVLRDNEREDSGSVAYWCLREVRDLNGNTVLYHYAKVEDAGVSGGTVPGYQIYIDKITYTGHLGGDGPYSVLFTRDRELSENKRVDVSIMGNLGFKQVTADLLRKIEVQFDGKNIRSYELKYKTGEFYKTLLESISEFDAGGILFNTHTFSYYNEINKGSFIPFSGSESWNVPSDGIEGGLLISKTGFDDNASVLSGNRSNDFGFGMTVTAGFNDSKLINKSNTLGGSFGFSKAETEGRLYLIDINGDGLADKVMADKNGFRYRANQSGPDGTSRFSQNWIAIKNVGEFFKEKSKTTNYGFEAQGGFGKASAFVGKGRSKTTSVTSVYFTDVNGDQLPDLVKNGIAHFNHYDPVTGVVTFLPDSQGTPSPIGTGGSVSDGIFQVDPAELEQEINDNPLSDVVRTWRAPFAGKISINGSVRLVNTNQDVPNADGVNVTIQKNGSSPLWVKRIQANDFSPYTPAGVNSITVNKGDRIYFRVQSVFNGEADLVEWSPIIEYAGKNFKKVNSNGQKIYRYAVKEDFILSAPIEIATPIAGEIRIEGVFEKPKTTDDVLVEIIRKTESGDIVEFSQNYPWDTVVNVPITLNEVVAENESFVFKVTSQTNVSWPALRWKPHLYYTASHDSRVTELFRDGEPVISYKAVPKYSLFAHALHDTASWVVYKKVDSIKVTPTIKFQVWPLPGNNPFTGEMIFSVKKRDTLLVKRKLNIVQGQISPEVSFKIHALKNDTLYFDYHTANEKLAEALTDHKVDLTIGDKDSTVVANLYTVFEKKEDFIFGPLYRQWGFFGYNGNKERAAMPIREEDLKLSTSLQKEFREGDVENPDDLDGSGAYDPAKENFIMFFARGKDQAWTGNDELTYVNATQVSSSRMGDDDLTPVQAVSGGSSGAIRAINKISKSESNSLSGGVGFSGVGNASANKSNGSSRVLSDFMDMNGDRYPDIVTEKGIQFTEATGKLQDKIYDFVSGNIQQTTTSSTGASAGGFVKIQPKGSTTNAKQVKSDVGGAKSSGVINVNYGQGDNTGNISWQDINGDGLPDRVSANGMAQLNLGYKLSDPEPWLFQGIQVSESESFGGGLGFSIGTGSESSSISGGIGLSRSDNETSSTLQDINGDGLTDQLVLDGGVKVKLNTGSGFVSSSVIWPGASKINENSTTGESANIAFTGCVPLGFIPVKICFNPSGNIGRSMSRDENRIADIDGDGNPDYLVSDNDGDLKVKRSTIGRTNMLKSVSRPLGASFALSYKRIGNTYEMPNNVWALDSVKVFDGFKGDGVDNMLTTYTYEEGLFDRHEREFYGFKKVITNTHDTEKQAKPVYTSVKQTFINDNYYEKGLMVNELMTDGGGKKFIEKENVYQLKDISTGANHPASAKQSDFGNAFSALIETKQKFYEGQSDPGKSTSMTYGYDAKGNVTNYTDFGDEGDDDNISAAITYHNLDNIYVIGTPQSILVTGSGTTYRKRESVIDPLTGDIKQIKQFLTNTEFSAHDMEYNGFGNLITITRPKNSKDQRLSFNYEYDNQVHTYTTKASNSYGYSSEATYDFRYGQVLSSKDLNGNEITYELDNLGRVVKITGPYEKGGAGYTIKFEYHPEATVPWALTRHFDPSDPKNDLLTAIFVDGLGRVLQTKKDAAIYAGDGKADTEMMTVSGRVKFDAFGRTISAFYPITEASGTPGAFNATEDTVKPTFTTYDVLNRTLNVTLPDNAVTQTAYGFESDKNGQKQFSTKTTDANSKQTEQFTDVKGRVTSVKNYTSDKPVWTSFKYNAINEQIEATDDLGHTTFSAYDNFGRRINRKHPDAGTTTYSYDLAGNLKELVTANLVKEGQAIFYTYDFERLTNITYPQNPENNVKYTYGEAGATDNRAGRIVLQEDASGAQEFFYGSLGEVVKNIRTVVIPQHDEQTYVTEWTYDTWNRLTSMVYADGEKVDYTYNAGGLLRSMSGKKKSATFAYVNQLGYDKFEQRVFLAYGNGTKTTYNYEPDRRRLSNMAAKTKAGRLMMDNVYGYDKVNNILSLKNNAPIPSSNLMGGSSDYSYEYDDLYRLTKAQGSFKGTNDVQTYTLGMNYNSVGGITHKVQHHEKKTVVQKKTTYDLTYAYGEEQPHAPVHIGDQTFTYDANGNQTGWTDDKSGQKRKLLWDEENRIRSIYDNGSQHHYIYDASGERVLKGKSTGQRIFVNGEWKAGSGQMGNYTVYVNPYIVLKSGGYTKHYYIEGQRIVSKLGGGWDNNGQGPLKAGGNKVDYVGKTQRMFDGIVKNLKFLGADGQILTAGKSGKVPPGQINGTGNVAEAFRYFYHPDHLGSTSYVTDASGEVFQHLEYFAFGETFVEEHSNTDKTPYLFNGKELDEETGLYYYGARYYDPRTSIFLGVDVFTEKYPGWSPFQYALNNPISYVDVNGDSVELVIGKPYTDANGKDHPYGHVALRVYNKAEGYDKVYDFGRYGSTWGMGSKGDGILNAYSNSGSYLNEEMSSRSSVGYMSPTSTDQDKKIMAYFDNMIKEGSVYKGGAVPGGGGTAHKLQNDYDLFSNNCTTISSSGLGQIGMNWLGNEYDPRAALKMMEGSYKDLRLTRTEYLKGGSITTTYTPPPPAKLPDIRLPKMILIPQDNTRVVRPLPIIPKKQ